MISKLSTCLTEKLLSNGTISEEDKDLYIYGLFMLISHLMFFIIACIFGLILGCVFESIIFYIAFQFIRRYAGGYHASTETRCEVLSTLSILACIVVIRLSKTYDIQITLLIISALSAVCIFVFCPLDTPEKPLSDKEFRYFRKVSWIVLLVIIAVIVVSYIFKFKMVTVPCCLSLILESILLAAGKIKRVSQKQNVET
ncbi:MAG: accessory gene regulator B family protein [Acetobacter sp.]|nr:accessory gene regulator B family protein [Bacteroides sp.]MCM1341797.1 accessory gene regulator B family protein [Acetobacter sp.]MCM1433139.1 accessory gene regulator B family protein [Clostridiales bacterium]